MVERFEFKGWREWREWGRDEPRVSLVGSRDSRPEVTNMMEKGHMHSLNKPHAQPVGDNIRGDDDG